jgi:hypothetical protein
VCSTLIFPLSELNASFSHLCVLKLGLSALKVGVGIGTREPGTNDKDLILFPVDTSLTYLPFRLKQCELIPAIIAKITTISFIYRFLSQIIFQSPKG